MVAASVLNSTLAKWLETLELFSRMPVIVPPALVFFAMSALHEKIDFLFYEILDIPCFLIFPRRKVCIKCSFCKSE